MTAATHLSTILVFTGLQIYNTLTFKAETCLALQSIQSDLWERGGKQMCLEFGHE